MTAPEFKFDTEVAPSDQYVEQLFKEVILLIAEAEITEFHTEKITEHTYSEKNSNEAQFFIQLSEDKHGSGNVFIQGTLREVAKEDEPIPEEIRDKVYIADSLRVSSEKDEFFLFDALGERIRKYASGVAVRFYFVNLFSENSIPSPTIILPEASTENTIHLALKIPQSRGDIIDTIYSLMQFINTFEDKEWSERWVDILKAPGLKDKLKQLQLLTEKFRGIAEAQPPDLPSLQEVSYELTEVYRSPQVLNNMAYYVLRDIRALNKTNELISEMGLDVFLGDEETYRKYVWKKIARKSPVNFELVLAGLGGDASSGGGLLH